MCAHTVLKMLELRNQQRKNGTKENSEWCSSSQQGSLTICSSFWPSSFLSHASQFAAQIEIFLFWKFLICIYVLSSSIPLYIYLKDSSTVLLNRQYIPHTPSPNKERTPHRLTHTHFPPQPRGMHASWK